MCQKCAIQKVKIYENIFGEYFKELFIQIRVGIQNMNKKKKNVVIV